MSFPISITFDIKAPPVAAFDQIAKSATSLDQAMSQSAANFDKFGQSVSKMEGPLGSVGSSMGQLEGSMSGLEGSLGGAAGSMGEFAGSTAELNGAIGETGGFITEASGSMSELSGSTTETGGAMTELSGTTTEFNGAIGETGGFVTETGTAMGEFGTATDTTGTSLETLNTDLETTNTALPETATGATDTGTAMTDFGTATDTTNESLATSNDALGQIVPSLEDTKSGAEGSAQGFEDLVPAVEGTNTALDSSNGLLEGVSPLLASTGENAAAAETPMTDLGGAIGTVNEELPGVNGGLTSSNTLLGDYGEGAEGASEKTGDLQGSMATLAFGVTTLVGAGYGLVNSFFAIRDAGFRVEAANIRAEKSASTLDKAMLSVGKAIHKLATDSEAPIIGINRLQTAFTELQKLVDAGIISGPQYAAALNELKAAGDALEGSTIKDDNAIKSLNISLDGLGQKAQKADLENRKLTKTLEAQAKTWLDAGLNVATLVGGMGSMIQTITTVGSAAAILKGVFVDLAIVMSQSVIPVLAAIAVPVGIAVAAIVAFIAAVTAIRANLKVFDDLGVSIGKTFPQLVPLLDAGRQAFINFSDAINSSVSVMLGGFDSLTGGALKLQEHWDGFTKTLPQGTANVNVLSQGLTRLQMMMGQLGPTTKLTGNQFKIVGDSLVRMSDQAVIGAGSWAKIDESTVEYVTSAAKIPPAQEAITQNLTQSTTAMDAFGATAQSTGVILKEQSVNYSELTNAQKLNKISLNGVIEGLADERLERFNAIKAAENYLVAHGTTAEAVGLSGDVLIGYVDALKDEGPAYSASVQEASQYLAEKHKEIDLRGKSEEWILKTAAAMKEEDKAVGKTTETVSKHIQELQGLNTTLQNNSAELEYYADATHNAGRVQVEFNLGVQDAELALNKREFALARNAGELQKNLELLREGKIQEIAYGEGVNEAGQAVVKKSDALAKAQGAYDETNRLIAEENLLLIDAATGYQEVKTQIQAHTEALAQGQGALTAFNDEQQQTKALGNEVVQGYQDQQTALNDLALNAGKAVGQIAALRQELAETGSETVRFNAGLLEGKRSALEYLTGIVQAKGETAGFREEVLNAAEEVSGAMQDMSNLSTEALQQFIEVVKGIPEAFEGILNDLDSFGQKMISVLSKAGEEGKVDIEQNMADLEDKLNVQFSQPLKEKLKLETNRAEVQEDIDTLMGGLAQSLANNPLKVEADTLPAQGAIDALISFIDQKAAEGVTGFEPLRQALVNLSNVDMTNIKEFAPALAGVVLQAKAAGQPFDDLLAKFSEMGPLASMTASELDAVSAAYEKMGYDLDTVTGKITDNTGVVVGKYGEWGVGAKSAQTDTEQAMGGIGAAGDGARDAWARDMQIMFLAVDEFGKHAQTMAGTVSGAYSNMSNNVHASLTKLASYIQILLAAFVRTGSDSQKMATTVSGSFSNMATNISSSTTKANTAITTLTTSISTLASSGASKASSFASSFSNSMSRVVSSANNATSSVQRLAQAINSLRDKTVTITTQYRTVGRPAGAAAASTGPVAGPTAAELAGAAATGPIGESTAVKNRAVNLIATEPASAAGGGGGARTGGGGTAGKEVVRELPIVIKIGERTLLDIVNRRIFEMSDALI